MADREVIRENTFASDWGTNLILGIVIAIILGVIIYFIANGTIWFGGQPRTINVNTTTPTNTTAPATNNGGTTTDAGAWASTDTP